MCECESVCEKERKRETGWCLSLSPGVPANDEKSGQPVEQLLVPARMIPEEKTIATTISANIFISPKSFAFLDYKGSQQQL